MYKERNMLMTEQQLSHRKGIRFPQPDRVRKVQKSMGAVRQVLGERKREKIKLFLLQKEMSTRDAAEEEEIVQFDDEGDKEVDSEESNAPKRVNESPTAS